MSKDWLNDLTIGQTVWHINHQTKRMKKTVITNIQELCIILDNGDVVDNKEGENLHRTHYIAPIKIARR